MALLLLFALPYHVFSQKKDVDSTDLNNEDLNQKIVRIAEQTDTQLDYTDLFENFEYYRNHPVNLNNATFSELQRLLILTDIQINNLLSHIEKNGKLISLVELQSIAGFDHETILRLLPYVYVSGKIDNRHFTFKEMLDNSTNQFVLRYQQVLQQEQGFLPISDSALSANPNSRYLGSPGIVYARYRFNYYNNISVGVTAKKDAGEQFFKGTEKNGFDFYSAHLFLRNFGILKALAIGDFQAQFGQGLTLWTGLGFGKSQDGTDIKKFAQGISPYRSVTDNLFMRGIATTIGYKDFEMSLFFSRKKIDANITSSDSVTGEVLYISSLEQSGLHATAAEIADKDAISENAYGGHICYKTRKLNFGATAFRSEYSADLQHPFHLYNQFEFNGKRNANFGVDYSYIIRNLNLFGEFSQSENTAKALLAGLLICPDKKLSLSLLYRNYDKKYQALYSSAFAESSSPANEKGVYIGILLKPFADVTVNAYVDNMIFPWLKYRVDSPSNGVDNSVQANWKPSKKLEMYILYRLTNKEINVAATNDVIDIPSKTTKQSCEYNIVYKVSVSVTLKNRVEFLNYKVGDGVTRKGYLIYQDVAFRKMKTPLSFSMRFALFDADSYDSRIYAFETDVLNAYSVPEFYYKGTRFYITARYSLNWNIDIWVRFSETDYSNRNSIGTGLTQINGHLKDEIETQLRIKF